MPTTMEFLRQIAETAAAETLPRFRTSGRVANKLEGGFDPVTEADREAERAIRALINKVHPDHGILGEEFGAENTDRRHVWVIDPIDGTRAFISGLPVWGTLVGLMADGKAVAGMMAQPFTGELFAAVGGKGIQDGPIGVRPLATRATKDIGESILFTTTPALFAGTDRDAYDRLEAQVRLARYGCDCYAFAMLAAGHVDLVIEAGLQSYDIVGLIPPIEAAGGVVTRWDGSAAEGGGNVIAAATPELHAAALAILVD
ncbi:MAG: histidinol-phosphatase [Rhizobiaceae bacterium]